MSIQYYLQRTIVALLWACLSPGGNLRADDVPSLRQARADLLSHYEQDLARLGPEARAWRPASPASGELLFVVADQYSAHQSVDGANRVGPELRTLRHQFAESLYALAERAAAAGESSLAFQWATEVLRENPHHRTARRALGYELVDGMWLTAFAQRMQERSKVWHAEFGWVAQDDVPRLVAGERRRGVRWISAQEDARRRRSIENGWQVRTDHFLVTTNHSISAGAELAARLERLYQVWRQLFAGFYLEDRELRHILDGQRRTERRNRPFHILFYKSREEYVALLRRLQPQIADTLGIYFDTQHRAHFFAADHAASTPADVATLQHEAVHQLFQESQQAARHIGSTYNFWVVEGIATYFESLTEHHDPRAGLYFTIGEPSRGRLPAARQRVTSGGFYLPWREITLLGKFDLQRHPQIAKLYSQAGAMATFLMHADNARLREPLVRYLQHVYAGRDKPATFVQLADCSYSELDDLFLEFLHNLP